jgi:hypothetical protein
MSADMKKVTVWRLAAHTNGWPVLPNRDKLCVLKGWPEVVATKELITGRWARMRAYKATGMRIADGSAAIDADINHPIAEKIRAAMMAKIESWGVDPTKLLIRRGKGSKIALFCQTEEIFSRLHSRRWRAPGAGPDDDTHQIEIFGGGSPRQFGVHGPHSHNDNGSVAVEYRWEGPSPAEVPLKDLPVLTKAQFYELVDLVDQMLREAGFEPVARSTKGESEAGTVSDLGDYRDKVFDLQDRRQMLSLADLKHVRATEDGEIRCSASWLEGPEAKNTSRCIVGMTHDGRLTIWESASGVTHMEADIVDTRDWAAAVEKIKAQATAPTVFDKQATPHCAEEFWAYLPQHRYIYEPTGDLWPAESVRNALSKMMHRGESVPANVWLDKNRSVEQMTWAPGLSQVIEDRLVADGGWIERPGARCFNLYRPPVASTGDADKAQRWIEHVHEVYPGEAEHIIQWLAHRVQRPGEKINHALVLGGSPGIGKDTILEPVKAAVGAWNFCDVSPQQVMGRFNGFLRSVILRINEARDLGDTDRFTFYDHTKAYTAAPPDVLRIDTKNTPEYAIPNVCGLIITTNHKTDGLYLPDDDRRHFVAWSPKVKEYFTPDYWAELYAWYGNGGYGHVAALLGTMDISRFDPKAPPLKTDAFWEMVNASRTPEDAGLADVLDELGRPDVVTLDDIREKAVDPTLHDWLGDGRNRRRIPHRMEACGYGAVRNPYAQDGVWKIGGKRLPIYARSDLPAARKQAAAEARARQPSVGTAAKLAALARRSRG